MINAIFGGDVWLAPSLMGKKEEIKSSLIGITGNQYTDVFLCNLEAPFLSDHNRFKRRALLQTEPDLLNSLKIADSNILILANNHICDYGDSGLLKTIEGCCQEGFLVVGAGKNLVEARKPIIIQKKNRTIAIMAYSETATYVGALAAKKNKPGVAPLEIDIICKDITNIKNKVDDIWVFLHWGKEYVRYPMPMQKQIARVLIANGATMIIGHHPHVLVGHEKKNNCYIYYSLGNFIFPDVPLQDDIILKWNKISRASIIIRAVFDRDSWDFERIFLSLNSDGLPVLDNNTKAAEAFRKMSEKITTLDYARNYKFLFASERVRHFVSKLIDIRKLKKDIIWKINNK